MLYKTAPRPHIPTEPHATVDQLQCEVVRLWTQAGHSQQRWQGVGSSQKYILLFMDFLDHPHCCRVLWHWCEHSLSLQMSDNLQQCHCGGVCKVCHNVCGLFETHTPLTLPCWHEHPRRIRDTWHNQEQYHSIICKVYHTIYGLFEVPIPLSCVIMLIWFLLIQP